MARDIRISGHLSDMALIERRIQSKQRWAKALPLLHRSIFTRISLSTCHSAAWTGNTLSVRERTRPETLTVTDRATF